MDTRMNATFGNENFFSADETTKVLVDRKHRRPVKKLQLRAEDGRLLEPEDTQLLLATVVGSVKAP